VVIPRDGSGGAVDPEKDGFAAERGGEFPEFGAVELNELGRRGGATPALEEGEGGEPSRSRRVRQIEFDAEGDGVAGGGGGELGRAQEAEHREKNQRDCFVACASRNDKMVSGRE